MGVGLRFVFLMHKLLALHAGRLHAVGTTDTALQMSCKSHMKLFYIISQPCFQALSMSTHVKYMSKNVEGCRDDSAKTIEAI